MCALKVLMELCEAPQKPQSLPTFKIKYSALPTALEFVYDLFENNNTQFRNPVIKKIQGNVTDLFAEWMLLKVDPGAHITKGKGTPITAWGVKASPKGGLSCKFQLPEALSVATVFISPVGNCDEFCSNSMDDQPLFHSTFTPAGTITDIHSDGVLCSSVLGQPYRTKLSFTWPSTTVNRTLFGNYHGGEHSLLLCSAMAETVNDFELTILKPGDAIKLEPGMIHVVFSLTNSAGGRWEYVDAKWFDSRVREKGEMGSGPD